MSVTMDRKSGLLLFLNLFCLSCAFFTARSSRKTSLSLLLPLPPTNVPCRRRQMVVDTTLVPVIGGASPPRPSSSSSSLYCASCSSRIYIEEYRHKNFPKLTYLYKKPAPGRENDKPIILIHPVGVGLSSWFWMKLLEGFEDNPPIYAPDLIGCGLNHGADPWDPEKVRKIVSFRWVEGVETLLQTVILPSNQKDKSSKMKNSGDQGCLVIVQGGLAPVGIMLADRNPSFIGALMLTSPPTYKDVTTAIPEAELARNYNFLRSPIFGNLAFTLLENKEIVRFFSNVFLFAENCDERWLEEIENESRFVQARTPVQVFNAGFLQHRSFETELKSMKHQPKMIVSGEGDKRVIDREPYATEIPNCKLKTIVGGTNVIPWENPQGTIALIKEMGY
eukprot:scaffold26892_cov132-Cylindrotheca_fusiformis.AAC.1